MKRLSLVFCGLIMTALPCTSALADTLFNYSYSGELVYGSGQITTNEVSPGTFQITSLTGSVDGVSIDGFLSANFFEENDYFLNYPVGSPDPSVALDALFEGNSGPTFDLFDGGTVSVLYGENGYMLQICDPAGDQTTPLTITEVDSSPVPEPGSLALMGTGALGVAGILRRRLGV
jgi:hypothetical protein